MTLINGILLLYRRPFNADASTIMEHVNSFEKYSRFNVWVINTEYGFPEELKNLHFSVIVFHYSFFFSYSLDSYRKYLEEDKCSYKVALFQDEHHGCKERFEFINHFSIDCIFTLVEPPYFKDTYEKYTCVSKIVNCIPGHVSEELIHAADQYALPDEQRSIDVGYRGRQTPYSWGKGAQEKTEIAYKFYAHAKDLGLRLDIETGGNHRIYGNTWHQFLGNCKGMLAVEAGVSIFDIEGDIYRNYQKFMNSSDYDEIIEKQSAISFEVVSTQLHFEKFENNIPYRTISPRHFEAAAFRICQILYEGNYSGILKPMVHYIPLKKDFSNFDEVIRNFMNPQIRRQLTENAYNDLIASGVFGYEKFINTFDKTLIENGVNPEIDEKTAENVSTLIKHGVNRCYQIKRLKHGLLSPIISIFHRLPKRNQRSIKIIFFRLKINPNDL